LLMPHVDGLAFLDLLRDDPGPDHFGGEHEHPHSTGARRCGELQVSSRSTASTARR
jgi:hypothetical protein